MTVSYDDLKPSSFIYNFSYKKSLINSNGFQNILKK